MMLPAILAGFLKPAQFAVGLFACLTFSPLWRSKKWSAEFRSLEPWCDLSFQLMSPAWAYSWSLARMNSSAGSRAHEPETQELCSTMISRLFWIRQSNHRGHLYQTGNINPPSCGDEESRMKLSPVPPRVCLVAPLPGYRASDELASAYASNRKRQQVTLPVERQSRSHKPLQLEGCWMQLCWLYLSTQWYFWRSGWADPGHWWNDHQSVLSIFCLPAPLLEYRESCPAVGGQPSQEIQFLGRTLRWSVMLLSKSGPFFHL